jgi:hypothetical protein
MDRSRMVKDKIKELKKRVKVEATKIWKLLKTVDNLQDMALDVEEDLADLEGDFREVQEKKALDKLVKKSDNHVGRKKAAPKKKITKKTTTKKRSKR